MELDKIWVEDVWFSSLMGRVMGRVCCHLEAPSANREDQSDFGDLYRYGNPDSGGEALNQ
jgi:hypothetical protein